MAIFNKERMVVTVFKVTFVAMFVALVLLWLLGGGLGKIMGTAASVRFDSLSGLLSASNTASFAQFRLPGQMDAPQINISSVQDRGGNGGPSSHAAFAGSSPYLGEIALIESSARSRSVSGQYLELAANPSLAAAVDISGWKLESSLTGNNAHIPQAADQFAQGEINAVGDVILPAGGRVIVATGPSPVGVSFRENECTGYLGTLQPFVPPLPQICPSPLDSIQNTPANEAALGADCFAYLQSLPACTFPATPPPSLSAACKTAIQNTLSYGGCVDTHRNDLNFLTPSWRLFLAEETPLWGSQHDVIRLLDDTGRVVDMINY